VVERSTFRVRQVLRGHRGWLWWVRYRWIDDILYSGAHDQSVRSWDPVSGAQLGEYRGFHNAVFCTALTADGALVAASTERGQVTVWNTVSGDQVGRTVGHEGRVGALAIHPDGGMVVSGGRDGVLRFWDVPTGRLLFESRVHEDAVWCLAFSFDGSVLASGSADRTLRVWDPATGRCVQKAEVGSPVWSVAFDRSGPEVVAGDSSGSVTRWRVGRRRRIGRAWKHPSRVTAIAHAPSGRSWATSCEDGSVRAWSDTGRALGEVRLEAVPTSLGFAADGRLVVGTRGAALTVLGPDLEVIGSLPGHEGGTWSVGIVGAQVASGGEDGYVRLWDLDARRQLQEFAHARPYERMNLTGTDGLSSAAIRSLLRLGAVVRDGSNHHTQL
jgi:WD40 repeat protein